MPKQASVPSDQRQLLHASAWLAILRRIFRSNKVGGLSLVLIRTHMSTIQCNGYEPVLGIGWRRLVVWDGWLGPVMTNISKTEMVFNHNHQITIKTNLSMSNYLDQLREQVRLKILIFKEQKKLQQPGLSSIYDHINTQTQDSKK